MIEPYNRASWERVLCAFSEYLCKMSDYSKAKREHAENELKARQIECQKIGMEHKRMNGHLRGIGAYSLNRLPMRNGAPKDERQINMTHHSNGQPILWRVEPLPVSKADKLYMAQLRLTA